MASELLATGTTAADSDDVIVAEGAQLTVALKDDEGPSVSQNAFVDILIKDDAGEYFRVGQLTGGRPAVVLLAAGTYRFSRRAGGSCGVFSA